MTQHYAILRETEGDQEKDRRKDSPAHERGFYGRYPRLEIVFEIGLGVVPDWTREEYRHGAQV